MWVCGIDVSSRAIDCVLIDVDGVKDSLWHRYDLRGIDAWERTRDVPRFGDWTQDVLAFGIENPQARGLKYLGSLMVTQRIVGAVLARLPRSSLVQPWQPAEWRKAVGLPGNCKKEVVRTWVRERLAAADGWPQDAADAYCLALATAGAIEAEVDGGSISSVG